MSSRLTNSTLTPGGNSLRMQLAEKIDRAIDLFAECRIAARIGQDHADLDRLSARRARSKKRECRTNERAAAQQPRAQCLPAIPIFASRTNALTKRAFHPVSSARIHAPVKSWIPLLS